MYTRPSVRLRAIFILLTRSIDTDEEEEEGKERERGREGGGGGERGRGRGGEYVGESGGSEGEVRRRLGCKGGGEGVWNTQMEAGLSNTLWPRSRPRHKAAVIGHHSIVGAAVLTFPQSPEMLSRRELLSEPQLA